MSRRPHPHRAVRAIIVAAAMLAGVALPAAAAPADDLALLVDAGRSADAWARCDTIDSVAEPRTDLWCGIAAVDIGRAGWGVMALERYTLRFPDDPRGRLELARAYFYAGDDLRSREEFEAIGKLDPPAPVRAGIQRYLDALDSRQGRYRTRVNAWVEIGAGWDSNVNAGVAQADLSLPVFGAVRVADAGVQQSDAFGWLAANASIDHPVAPGVTLHGGVWGSGNFYRDLSDLNLGNAGVSLAASYLAGPNIFALSYAHGEIMFGGSTYRSSNGVGLEWRRQLSELAVVSVAPQFARLDYSGVNSVRDADLGAVSVAFRRWWLTQWQPVMSLTAFAGDEHNRTGRPDLGRKLYGAGADVTVSPTTAWALTAGIAYVRSDYSGDTPVIGVARQDDNWALNLGAAYFITRNWSARVDYQYARNDSNIALYEYTRSVVAAKLRYDFR
ncbi:MAG: outer membrane beta-barrel protein [Betaproteobacteria bacterium]